jgi:hypothetical protein
MKTKLTKLLVGSAALMLLLVFANISNAQKRRARGKTYTKGQVENVIKRVDTRTDNFVDNFDDSLDNSNLNGTKREDNLMKKAKRLEKETDQLKKEFDKKDRWIENKPQVRRVLNLATEINRTVKKRRLGKKTETNWAKLRYELNTLAKIYNLQPVGASVYK